MLTSKQIFTTIDCGQFVGENLHPSPSGACHSCRARAHLAGHRATSLHRFRPKFILPSAHGMHAETAPHVAPIFTVRAVQRVCGGKLLAFLESRRTNRFFLGTRLSTHFCIRRDIQCMTVAWQWRDRTPRRVPSAKIFDFRPLLI